ncbi:hypothetical protein Asppvi_000712 [Aspergillus pseudoviridinutans]|uniref:Uncharacterized protein n=1 Tax=Aspergillus pseudoviridinutans TaxID=1517512 RepID=A0A9P3B6P8_9EURO|nr:uncharacterized protein Asppvi_000712 [Aspergillus pseudoviridinutans]GIJ82206.1 hypothetical protein Asppvi_000712 [Aspergillus pseudoviridinutans]
MNQPSSSAPPASSAGAVPKILAFLNKTHHNQLPHWVLLARLRAGPAKKLRRRKRPDKAMKKAAKEAAKAKKEKEEEEEEEEKAKKEKADFII